MTKWVEPLFTPKYHSSHLPRWFIREAVAIFGLRGSDVKVFLVIADNLDAQGASRTSTTAITTRGGMSRSTAVESLDRLIAFRLIIELDEKRSGRMMRYGIPRERPPAPGELPI